MYTLQSISITPDSQVWYFWIPNLGNAYVVGDDGTVWSRYRGIGRCCILSNEWTRLVAPPDVNGYPGINLCFNGIRFRKRVHELVCEAVYGPCPSGLEVCHNDGDQQNNYYWNLRYGTPKSNCADKVKHGSDSRGENCGTAVLTWVKVREIRAKYFGGGYTQKGLALEYGVSDGNVNRIIKNLMWVENQPNLQEGLCG